MGKLSSRNMREDKEIVTYHDPCEIGRVHEDV